MKKWLIVISFCRRMGGRYIYYRLWYYLKNHLSPFLRGLGNEPHLPTPAIYNLSGAGNFFFQSREAIISCRTLIPGQILKLPNLPGPDDWLCNPCTGYHYPLIYSHRINDFSEKEGDIKDIWNLSRFPFLYELIRYDFFQDRDCSAECFQVIEDWIKANPPNKGPNWKCSQEISIRLFAWTFALFYYRNSTFLTPDRLEFILHSIRIQARQIEKNINYARFVVRNNHALTETLLLYIIGTLFPFFPESPRWQRQGKHWFQQELCNQVGEDGAFLQHSMNYQRVVIQLLTWAIQIAELNQDRWAPVLYRRAEACLHFLKKVQDQRSGWLPNYGPNDGALFFPLSSAHFRDYRPQLAALAAVLKQDIHYSSGPWQEETFWITRQWKAAPPHALCNDQPEVSSFSHSGYFICRNHSHMLFIRCGHYNHRPTQADNLHLDFWSYGQNLLYDAGTYRYNTAEKLKAYYAGTEAHNTIAIEYYDQMQRGPRFIWTHWIKTSEAECFFDGHNFHFKGQFTGFTHLVRGGITHKREIVADASFDHIVVTDTVINKPPSLRMRQLWHPCPLFLEMYGVSSLSESGETLTPQTRIGWYSETYGQKTPDNYLEFSTYHNTITTNITSRRKKMPSSFEYKRQI